MYLDVVRDIIKYYSNVVSEKELEVLRKIEFIINEKSDNDISDEIIYFINRILDRIWNLTLTDIKSFKNGDEFCFLVKESVHFFEEDKDYSNISGSKQVKIYDSYISKEKDKFGHVKEVKMNIVETNYDKYKLLTNEDMIEFDIEEDGEIISINYTNNLRTKPLLPIYFKNGSKRVDNLNYETVAYYAVDTKLGKDDTATFNAIENSAKNNKPYILIDKMLYREFDNKEILSNSDIESIIFLFIMNYISSYEKLNSENTNIKDEIYKHDKEQIKQELLKFYTHKISLDELKYNINEIIASRIDLTQKKSV